MLLDQHSDNSLLRLGGIAGIGAALFLPGVILQTGLTSWFPEEALQQGDMTTWLEHVAANRATAMTGVAFSIAAIISFMPFGLVLYRLLTGVGRWQPVAALAFNILGVSLALAAFTFAFGFTWALTDLAGAANGQGAGGISALATMGMRGFLVCDDLATCLIGLSNGLYAYAGLRSKVLPRWLGWWGMIAGFLVTIVLLRYFFPIFAIAAVGYPLVVLWFAATGILMLRKAAG